MLGRDFTWIKLYISLKEELNLYLMRFLEHRNFSNINANLADFNLIIRTVLIKTRMRLVISASAANEPIPAISK